MIPLPFATAALICASAVAQPHLVFDHKIGTDWKPDSNHWMSFVAIRSDGSAVAADGNLPGVESEGMGVWTFPAGGVLQSAPERILSISADFRYLATDKSVLELRTGRAIVPVAPQGATYALAAFDPPGEHVALVHSPGVEKADRGQINVLRVVDGSLSSAFGSRHTTAVAFHPDGRILASGHWNNVTLWDSRTGVKLALLFHGGQHVTGAGLNRDGRYVYGIGFSRDGKLLAAGTDDGELQIWDVLARKLLHSLNIGGGDVSNPAFTPDGKLLAAGTYGDGTVSLVDASSGMILSQVKVSMFGCGSVAFSPDGQFLVTPSNGGQIGSRRFDRGGSVRVFRVEN